MAAPGLSPTALTQQASTKRNEELAVIRKAAGSQSLSRLEEAIRGWTATELDEVPGKNPLHMAAWKGCLSNVEFLIEKVGCDVNAVSTGTYSYGKTALFFALTQSRADVCRYLLNDRNSTNVRIVNNKGQTPLSIAASHFDQSSSSDVVKLILQRENEQDSSAWSNYRHSHSDGLVYGDLDPRFLERPIVSTDSVTAYTVNPTTSKSRKGNFRRHNPQAAREGPKRKQTNNHQKQKKKFIPSELTPDECVALENAWNKLEDSLCLTRETVDDEALKAWCVAWCLSSKKRGAWLPAMVERLKLLKVEYVGLERVTVLLDHVAAQYPEAGRLTDRFLARYRGDSTGYKKTVPQRTRQSVVGSYPIDWKILEKATNILSDLSIGDLERDHPEHLSLSKKPVWVDSDYAFQKANQEILRASLVGVDTEWCGDGTISTIQIAIRDRSWIFDLLVSTDMAEKFRTFLQTCFQSCIVLGFSLRQDLPKLDDFVGCPLPHDKILDVQLLWKGSQMPGLARCVAEVASLPLSKTQQCSEWAMRPLSLDQLGYAGLDAVVVSYLFAEKRRVAAKATAAKSGTKL